MDTTGYTRQQVQQSNRAYVTLSTDPKSISNKQTGLGVTYSRVKQVRDYSWTRHTARNPDVVCSMKCPQKFMEEVAEPAGRMNGEAFQTTMTDFWTAIQELSKDPSSSVTQGMLVQRAAEFVQRAGAVYSGLSSYQNNLNTQIKQNVDKINKYGNQLLTLNDQIRAIESGGIEHANDLRDARNQILDELAELTNMTFSEDRYGSVSVQIEGVDFVKDGTCYEIALKTDEATGFYTPFWPQDATYTVRADGTRDYNIDGAEVFDLSVEISSDLNTDVGGLKAMLLARGDHRVFALPDIIDGITEYCEKEDYQILLVNLRLYKKYGDAYYQDNIHRNIVQKEIQKLLSKQVEGIIYVASHERLINVIPADLPIPTVVAYGFTNKGFPRLVICPWLESFSFILIRLLL